MAMSLSLYTFLWLNIFGAACALQWLADVACVLVCSDGCHSSSKAASATKSAGYAAQH